MTNVAKWGIGASLVIALGAGAAFGAVRGSSSAREPGADVSAQVPSPAGLPAWMVKYTDAPRWADGIEPEAVTGCEVADETACLVAWAEKRLDGSVGALDSVAEVLTRRTLSDQRFFQEACHDVWHDVGERIGALYRLETVMSRISNNCHGGVVHGAMSGRAVEVGAEDFLEEVAGVCDIYEQWPAILQHDCQHGVGHGYGSVATWETMFDACAEFEGDATAYDWCASGAIETLFARQTEDGEDIGVDAEELPGLCAEMGKSSGVCWRYIIFPLLSSGQTLPEIAELCTTFDARNEAECALAVGGVAASGWEHGTEDLGLCGVFEHDASRQCWLGAARSVVRAAERFNLAKSPKAAEVPEGWRISLCPITPQHLHSRCEEMEEEELGDELDQIDQIELLKQWNRAHQVPWQLQPPDGD